MRNRNVVVDNDKTNNDETLGKEDENLKPVPPSVIYGHSLKKIKSYKNVRREYKLSNQKTVFLQDVGAILKEFPVENHTYDDELLIEISNIAEKYFVYGSKDERNKIKQEALDELMLPYFKDDLQLLHKTIQHVWKKIKKTNVLKRVWSRTKHFFFQMVVMSS